ncbi:MAG TPA: 6-carboxytetrahydropterin synthase QueD [Syntrophales bacterium]|nr:6-carboxytetrahydropterin synthase QueD [Syntrophales bacterium]HQB29179.1 6-carboxytetrahydropterin synthase QueD [Syntrophales bacterium]HQN77331.1 6-carboxytetrahydropterin synthase QueD [Syntrophales bacterium]HQQ26319.1 6-carboxytetrahydropterin synthase QueD [Syntrophales bacterium]
MYEVTIEKTFSAAHALSEIGGKCESLHGHNFTVEVTVAGPELNGQGLLLDFRVLKEWTGAVLDRLDHRFLNEVPSFRGRNPSSENIARFIFDEMKKNLAGTSLTVSKVTVRESENARATYRENG